MKKSVFIMKLVQVPELCDEHGKGVLYHRVTVDDTLE